MQEVRWDEGGLYFVLQKRKRKSSIGNRFFVHHSVVLAVKREEFVSDKMTYIVLRRCWCNIIVLNVHAPNDKSDDSKDSFCKKLEQVFNHFSKCNMKILLGDFNSKLGREDLVVEGMKFPHQNIHKCTCISPDGKTHSQINHILIDSRWHSSILDVQSLSGTDRYLSLSGGWQ